MKRTAPLFLWGALAALFAAGCGHLDFSSREDPHRVLTGTVDFSGTPVVLPDDALMVIRVVDAVPPSPVTPGPPDPLLRHPVPPTDMPPEVLGEKTIPRPGALPIPFEVEYRAEEQQLMHGLNVEVRISYGGRVRYANVNHTVIAANDYNQPHTIEVSEVTR